MSERYPRQPPTHPLHVTYARACVQDGIDYFDNQLASSLKTSLEAFKKPVDFFLVIEIKPTGLTCLPFIGASEQESQRQAPCLSRSGEWSP